MEVASAPDEVPRASGGGAMPAAEHSAVPMPASSEPSATALPWSPFAIKHYSDADSRLQPYPLPLPPAPQPFPLSQQAPVAPYQGPVPYPPQPQLTPLQAAMLAPVPLVYAPIAAPRCTWAAGARLALNAAAVVLAALCALRYGAIPLQATGGAAAVAYVIYVCLSLSGADAQALRNHMGTAELLQHTAAVRAARPDVWARIECYHMEHRTRTVTRNGKSHRESYTVRVVTHTAAESWRFGICRDISGPPVYEPSIPMLEVHFKPVQDFFDEASHSAFESWRANFFARNRRDARACRAFFCIARARRRAARALAHLPLAPSPPRRRTPPLCAQSKTRARA